MGFYVKNFPLQKDFSLATVGRSTRFTESANTTVLQKLPKSGNHFETLILCVIIQNLEIGWGDGSGVKDLQHR